MDLINSFKNYLEQEDKSIHTINNYSLDVKVYIKWHYDTFGIEFIRLLRPNILEYKSYLSTVKKLNGKTINRKLSSLINFNRYLVINGNQDDYVVFKNDYIKVQSEFANPCNIVKSDVESLRQKILLNNDLRLYCVVTIMAYCGLRIQETLDIKLKDINLDSKELIIRKGKGNKQRVVIINNKIVGAIRSYLKVRDGEGEYLFISRARSKLDRTVVNKQLNKYGSITPHMLRHFYCTNAMENGFQIHEIANQAGHSNITTTLIYTNPSKSELRRKVELL